MLTETGEDHLNSGKRYLFQNTRNGDRSIPLLAEQNGKKVIKCCCVILKSLI